MTRIKFLNSNDFRTGERGCKAQVFHKPVIVKANNTDVLAMCLIASGTKSLFLTMSETLQY